MTHEKSEMTINIYLKTYAAVVELVDTLALGASAERRGGSSPLRGTILGKERKLPPSGAVFSLAARSACQLFFWGE